MFWNNEPQPKPYDRRSFAADLDKLISDAIAGRVSRRDIADVLEGREQTLRIHIATTRSL
jgi:hypothetical protein